MATAGAETGPQRSPGAIWTLVVVALATFMLMLDLTVVNVALPDIRAAFDSSFSALQWILDAYALGLAAVLLAAGSLADRLGRKRVFDVGLVVFVLSSLACGLAPSDDVLIVARFVQGLGGAILFAVGPALLGHEFRGKDRGMAFGVFGAVTGLAIAFGPLIGGGLAESAGWRWIFLINVPVTIAAMAIGYLKMRESRSETPPPVDWPGMIAFSAGLFFLVLGFMRGEADGWTSWIVLGCFALAVALLAGFTWLQVTRPDQAMFDLSLFGNRTFNGLSVVTALCALTVMPALFLLIAYVQNMLGHSAFASGLRFLPLTLLLFVAAAGAGTLVTKVHPGVLVGISQLLIAAGLAAVVLVDTESVWTALIPAMILIGLGMGVFNPPRAAFSIAVTTPDKSGMASGINETFQQAGVAVGIAAVGAFFHNQVSGAFAETDTAREVFGDQAATAGDAVAAGGPAAVLEGLPAAATDVVRSAAEAAFVDGLHTTMLLVAALAAISGVIALFTMRPDDLDEAALDSPGIPADGAGDSGAGAERPADRPSELAAQRAAQIIAQAKADAQEADGAGRTVSATLAKAPAAPAGGARRSKATARSTQTRADAATGRQRATATPDSDDATIRTTPVGRPADAAASRRGSSTARRSTAVDRPVAPSASAGDRGTRASDSARVATAEKATADNATVGLDSTKGLDSAKDSALTVGAVPRSPVSGRFTEATARRSARTSDALAETALAETDRAVTDRPGDVTTRSAAALSDAERREAAGKHRLTDPKAIATAARAAQPASPTTAAPAGDTPAIGEKATATATASPAVPASELDSTSSAAATEAGTAVETTTGSTSDTSSTTGRRATARSRTNSAAGGKHRAAGSEITAATPRHASGRRAAATSSAATSASATSSAATSASATSATATSAAISADTGASGSTTSNSTSSAATADAEAETSATGTSATEQTATKRTTARKRTRGAAKAPAAQATRAAEQPAKAAAQPAKAARQPAKRTTTGTARNTAAKKAAASGEKGTTTGARSAAAGTKGTTSGGRGTASTTKSTASGAKSTASGAKSTASGSQTTSEAKSTADRGSSRAASTGAGATATGADGAGATTTD